MSWASVVSLLQEIDVGLRKFHDQRDFYDLWNYAAVKTTPAGMCAALTPLLWKAQTASVVVQDDHPNVAILLDSLTRLRDSYVPNLHSNQYTHVMVLSSFQVIEGRIDECLGQDGVQKALGLPRSFATKLKAASTALDNSLSNLDNLEQRIELILSASETAADLPITLNEIKDAKQQLESARILTAGGQVEITKLLAKAGTTVDQITEKADHAEQVAAQIDGSYRAVTSQGLAQAFHLKEKALRKSIYVWVGFLFCSLCAMGAVGYFRFPEIQRALVGEPRWAVVVVEVILAAFSLGAPAWFAIISTKQIGQRFRLAEDYGYKAAISAAYEGYRSEAARYGEEFQTRLFASALDRLDEQPLRFVDHETGGSPMHEILGSLGKVIDAKAAKELLEKALSALDRWKPTGSKPGSSKTEADE